MLYALVCTEGHMNVRDIRQECRPEKWVPLVVYRKEDKTFLPLFESPRIARRFAERNFPKKWLTGIVNLNPLDFESIAEKGIVCITLEWQKKMKNTVEFDIVVHEYDPDTEVEVEVVKSN